MPIESFKHRRLAFALSRSTAGRLGLTAAGVAGGLLALDVIGFVATVYYGPELLKAAEAAGAAELLKRQ